jgi:molecular chaperone GrpE
LEEQLRAANDRLLRTQAELENYRKRARRDLEAERRYAAAPLIRDLLSVLDNLDLAVGAAEKSDNAAGLLEGVKMVAAQMQSVLEQHHCRRIDAVGQQFDPHLHEAVAQAPSEEHSAGQITLVARDGYQLHDRVIRPSQVYVSSGSPPSDEPTVQE